MKILITRDFLLERNYKEAFESLNYEVLNYRPTAPIEEIHNKVASFAPDLVLVHSPWDVTYKQLAAVKTAARDAIFVFATHEDPMEYDRFAEFAPMCDYHFSGDRDSLWRYEKDFAIQAEHLPVAANSFSQFPIELDAAELAHFSSDIAFIGNNYPNPERVASERKILHPFIMNQKYVFKVWGGDVIMDKHFRQITLGTIPYEDINKVYSSTKIGLGVARATTHEGYLTMRYFEGPACGCFMLVDYCKGLEKIFQNNKHMVFVFDEDNVTELVDYYLENEKERIKIAKAGRDFVLKNHTYVNRAKKILEVCGVS